MFARYILHNNLVGQHPKLSNIYKTKIISGNTSQMIKILANRNIHDKLQLHVHCL